jgi:hypothetical protein
LTTIRDLATFQVSLSKVHFPAIGSLSLNKEVNGLQTIVVGPLVSTSFCTKDPPYFFGPFRTTRERYLKQVDDILAAIERGDLFAEDSPVTVYLAHLELRDLVQQDKEMGRPDEEEQFYIKHADDKGDQIMIDNEGHITGIIDWEG